MSTAEEIIYESPATPPDAPFWLEQGRKILAESFASVHQAATELMKVIGVIQGIYLGILGFAKFVPENLPIAWKTLFILPVLGWLIALYAGLQVILTREFQFYLNSPADIEQKITQLLLEKQQHLQRSFWLLSIGLAAAFILVIVRLGR